MYRTSGKRLALLFGIFLYLTPAFAADGTLSTEPEKPLSLLGFDVHHLSVFQSGGNNFTGDIAWRPAYRLNDDISLQGNFGLSYMKGFGKNFFVTEYEVSLAYRHFSPYQLELGAGAQTWFQSGSTKTSPALSFIGSYLFSERWFGYVDRVSLGYTALLISNLYTSEIKVGVGFVL